MAFFNVTPAEKIDTLTETFGAGMNTSVREEEAKPNMFEGALGALGEGISSGFNRSKYNLYSPESDEGKLRRTQIAESVRKMQPDPKTVGSAGQLMFGVAEPLSFMATQFLQDPITSIVAPSTLAISVTKDFEPVQTELNKAQGMDAETATQVARTQATAMGIGTILPTSVTGGLLTRILSGGALNVAVGAGERAETGRILRANGYADMAKQYSALDGNAAAAEFILGGVFGGAFGGRSRVRANPDAVLPSNIDAALTANQSVNATVDLAPGIPMNGKSAQAHSQALNTAIEQLAFGDKVNVENIMTDAGFLGKRPDFNAVGIIREELEKAGFNDLARQVSDLETQAKSRGLYVDPADLNVVLSDAPAEIKVGGKRGAQTEVKIGNDYVPVEYRLMEVGDVRSTMDKADNQYRDRTRVASERQIAEAAVDLDPRLLGESWTLDSGAPVMTADGRIIAGNGRTAFIERAYGTNGGEGYRAYLRENADALGLSESEIDGMSNPVLVRVLKKDVDVNKAAILSNESGAMSMSALEQSKVDGERLGDFSAFNFTEDGGVSSAANLPFIRSWVGQFPVNQQARLMDAEGRLSAEGVRRLQNAVMYRAYGDSDTLSRLVEATDPGSRNIVAALSKTAARVADAKEAIARGDLYPLDLSEDLLSAVEKLDSIKRSGQSVNEWVAQIDAFGDGMTGEARALVVMLDKNVRSAKAISEAIDGYYSRLEELGDPKQGSMFEAATPTKQDVFAPMMDGEVMYSRAQTETPEFKKWFGKSKVVGDDKKPLIVYHGTNAEFEVFDYSKIGDTGRLEGAGFYFTNNKSVASGYGSPMEVFLSIEKPMPYEAKALGKPVLSRLIKKVAEIEAKQNDMDIGDGFLSNYGDVNYEGFNNVLREAVNNLADEASALDQLSGMVGSGVSPEVVNRAMKEVTGYDGIIAKGFGNEGNESNTIYVAFFPEQIKSATNNAGTFDPNNPSILYGRGGSRSKVSDLRDTFNAQFGKDAESLITAARVQIVQSVSELPARSDATPHPGDVGGMYDPRDGTTYIVADNTAPSQIRGRILHEIGVHAGFETMLGVDLYNSVLAHVDAKISSGDGRFIEARRLAEQNAAMPEHVPQETLAYLVENAPEMSVSRRILAAVRQWLYRVTGGRFVDLGVGDLVQMASASLRRQSRIEAVARGGDVPMYTREQESTPEFRQWFGDSKVVDDSGAPLVVYHGTAKGGFVENIDIEHFDKTMIGDRYSQDSEGFFFTNQKDEANYYATTDGIGRTAAEGAVYPVYLSLKNPLIISDKSANDIFGRTGPSEEGTIAYWDNNHQMLLEKIKSDGHDGAIIDDGAYKMYVALEPNQIKSAIGNSGAFNPDSLSLTDRIARTEDFHTAAMSGDTINNTDNPLITTMIPTGEIMEPIGLATAKADAEIQTASQMEPGFISAVECALVAGE